MASSGFALELQSTPPFTVFTFRQQVFIALICLSVCPPTTALAKHLYNTAGLFMQPHCAFTMWIGDDRTQQQARKSHST